MQQADLLGQGEPGQQVVGVPGGGRAGGAVGGVVAGAGVAGWASFCTGLKAGSHGMVGYQVLDRQVGANLNLLTGIGSAAEARKWQAQETVSEKAAAQSVSCYFVGPAEYQDSGFTNATMREAIYVPAKTIEDRVVAAQKILNGKESALVYLYVPELDQRAHAFGSKSGEWVEKLEDLDLAIRQLTKALPSNVGVLLTADHGIVDVATERHIYLDEFPLAGLVSVGGDPRVLFLYFDQSAGDSPSPELVEALQQFVGKRAIAATRSQVVDAGWYGQVSEEALSRMPEVFLIANGETALYHRDYAKPKSLRMVGQHGAISDDELFVPLLKFGAYQK